MARLSHHTLGVLTLTTSQMWESQLHNFIICDSGELYLHSPLEKKFSTPKLKFFKETEEVSVEDIAGYW